MYPSPNYLKSAGRNCRVSCVMDHLIVDNMDFCKKISIFLVTFYNSGAADDQEFGIWAISKKLSYNMDTLFVKKYFGFVSFCHT